MADGTIFEEHGLQTAAIITTPFLNAANAMSRRRGFKDFPYVVMRHPIGNLRPDEVRERALEVLPDVLRVLGITDTNS